MVQVASHLGGFLPGAELKYLVPGSALHICGTYRAGELSNTTTTYNNNDNNNNNNTTTTTSDQYSDYNNGYASSDYWNNGHGNNRNRNHSHSQAQTPAANAIPRDSVVGKNSRVWGQRDLYLGGCGVIPTQSACSPTLTAACFAIYAARHLVLSLAGGKGDLSFGGVRVLEK
jgi:choline dehydrogenase-like flavoprotein